MIEVYFQFPVLVLMLPKSVNRPTPTFEAPTFNVAVPAVVLFQRIINFWPAGTVFCSLITAS